MAPHGVVSADSHVTEPADLWQERLDRRFRDRAPHVTKNPGPGPAWLFLAEGTAPFPVCWLGEYCRHDPRRLYGAGLVSLEDVSQGVRDLEAIAKQGMRAAMIWGAPPEDRPYDDPAYDPFWRAAESLELPVSLHIIAGRGRVSHAVGNAVRGRTHSGVWYMSVLHEIQDSLARMVFGGVLHRFPRLRIVSAENDVGWIPHFMYRMDHCHEKYCALCPDATPEPPSFYLRRQLYATFQDDPIGPATHEIFGRDNSMWASDFPHSDSSFPESRQWIDKNFSGVPADVQRRIVRDNAVALYRMDLA